MLDAPRQNWELYRAMTAPYDRAYTRSLTVAEKFAIYEELFQFVHSQPRTPEELERLEASRWQQKLALRELQNRAFGNVKPGGLTHP